MLKKLTIPKFISVLLLTIILFNFIQIGNFKIYGASYNNLIEYTAEYAWLGESQDYEFEGYYTDEYFNIPSHEYNPSLMTSSLCVIAGICDTNDPTKPFVYSNIIPIFEKMEFPTENFMVNDDLTKTPTTTSIGVAFSSKEINNGDDTLIAVVVRAGDYQSEWANNFVTGKSGNAAGYDHCKNVVIKSINEYIDAYKITGNVKLWIIGYSRSASIANLVGGAINENPSVIKNVKFDHEDTYTICFVPSMAAERKGNSTNMEKGHENIHNIVNKDDIIGKLFPTEHGFGMYGVNHYIPNVVYDADFQEKFEKLVPLYKWIEQDDNAFAVNSTYQIMPNRLLVENIELSGGLSLDNAIIVDPNANWYPTGQFVDEFLTFYSRFVIKSRSEYVDMLQNALTIFFTSQYGTTTDGINETSINAFIKKFISRLTDPDVILKFSLAQFPYLDMLTGSNLKILNSVLTETLNEVGINNLSPVEIQNIIESVVEIISRLLIYCPDHFATVVANLDNITSKHDPRLTLAWLMLTDENYFDNNNMYSAYLPDAPIELSETADYKKILINGDVDIEVYDENNNLIGEMINGKATLSKIAVTTNYDDEKLVFLPVTNDYRIEVKAKGTGTVDYRINEFSYSNFNYTRLINYNDISMKSGDVLTGVVPKNKNYTLQLGGNTLKPTLDVKDKKATQSYYSIYVNTPDTARGTIIGNSMRLAGHYATVTAVAAANYVFDGWYINNVKVSDSLKYRFRVENDVSLIAKFVSPDEKATQEQPKKTIILPLIDMNSMVHNINFHVNGGSSIRQQQVKHGGQLTEPDSPTKKKMVFDGWYIDEALTKEYDFSTPVMYSFKLYAKWIDS